MKLNKKIIVGGIVAIMVLAGGAYAFTRPSATEPVAVQTKTEEAEAETEVTPQATSETPAAAPEPAAAAKAGAYTNYNASTFANIAGTRVLFFHASWCPQCRSLDASIKAGKVPDNTTIVKVDYDSNQALRQKYGVTIQTTLVRVDSSGKLVEKSVAYDEPTLQSVIDNLL